MADATGKLTSRARFSDQKLEDLDGALGKGVFIVDLSARCL